MEHKEHSEDFSNAGKGDKRRPRQVDKKTYSDNWNRIFKKKKKENPLVHLLIQNGDWEKYV